MYYNASVPPIKSVQTVIKPKFIHIYVVLSSHLPLYLATYNKMHACMQHVHMLLK